MTKPLASPGLPRDGTKERAVASAKVLFARYALVGVISLVGSTFLIRTLGPERWASFSVAYFLVAFFDQSFSQRLLGNLVRTPEAPDRGDREAAARLMQLTGALLLGLLAAAALPAAALYGREELSYCLLAAAVCVYVYATRSVSVALLERGLRYGWIAATEVLDQVVFYMAAVPLAALGYGLPGVAIALAARGLISAAVLRRVSPSPFIGRYRPPEIRKLLAFGLPAMTMATAVLVNGLVPAFALGGEHATELAFTMTTATIIGYGVTPAVILNRMAFPGLSTLQLERARFGSAVIQLVRVDNLTTVLAVLPIAATSPVWLPLLLGEEWREAGVVMAVVGVALMVESFNSVPSAALNSLGYPRDALRLNLLISGAYLTLAFALVQVSALFGVAIAMAVSRLSGTVFASRMLKRRGYDLQSTLPLLSVVAIGATMVGTSVLFYERQGVLAGLLTVGACLIWVVGMRRHVLTIYRSLRAPTGGSEPGA